jgi:hypothetical protein
MLVAQALLPPKLLACAKALRLFLAHLRRPNARKRSRQIDAFRAALGFG